MALSTDSSDFKALHRTVVGEAIGEGKLGQIAVAWVVMNRVKANKWGWANTIHDVCRQPGQFECMTNSNLSQLMNQKAARGIEGWLPNVFVEYADPTLGANHYYAFKGPQRIEPPSWADPIKRTVDIGNHRFYKL